MSEAGQEQRPWGYFELLLDEPGYRVKRVVVKQGERLSLQFHRHRSEHWHFVSGSGLAVVNDETTFVRTGTSLDIPQGCRHRLENDGEAPLVLVEIQRGEVLDEDDIVRLQDDYGRGS